MMPFIQAGHLRSVLGSSQIAYIPDVLVLRYILGSCDARSDYMRFTSCLEILYALEVSICYRHSRIPL